MTTRSQREFLQVQLLETQRLSTKVAGHPIMSVAYASRARQLQAQIDALPPGGKEARVILFFSGGPVVGSIGIDAAFAGRVLEPFQSMVMTDYADRWHGVVGARGKRAGEADSQLLLTALPRGSFGLELSRAPNDELFDEDHLADTLAHVTRLVDAAASSDEDFAAELDLTAPRVIQNLRVFLEVISKGKAGLRLESGDVRCTMTPNQASDAFARVADTITNEDTVKLIGVFKGALLESWKYDFVSADGQSIGGKIDENLTENAADALTRKFFNQPCQATLRKNTILFKNGRVRTTWQLVDLEAIEPADNQPQ